MSLECEEVQGYEQIALSEVREVTRPNLRKVFKRRRNYQKYSMFSSYKVTSVPVSEIKR
jgi:hypothetical protein